MNAAGLGYIVFDEGSSGLEGKGPIAKFIPSEIQEMILNKAGLKAETQFSSHALKAKKFMILLLQPEIKLQSIWI